MQLVPVTSASKAAAVELLCRFYREEGFTTPPERIAVNLQQMLSDPWCWCALGMIGDEPVAVVAVTTMLSVEWGRLGEIDDLYVVPQHRRRGIARHLVNAAMLWCRGMHCSAVVVTITPEGEQTHRLSQFYARLKFSPTRRATMTALLPVDNNSGGGDT